MSYGKSPVVKKRLASEVPKIMHGPSGQKQIMKKSPAKVVEDAEEAGMGSFHSADSDSELHELGSNLLHEQDGIHHDAKGFMANKL